MGLVLLGRLSADATLALRGFRGGDQGLQIRNAFFLGEKRHDIGHAQLVALTQGKELAAGAIHRLFLGIATTRLLLLVECGQFFLELPKSVFLDSHRKGVIVAMRGGHCDTPARGDGNGGLTAALCEHSVMRLSKPAIPRN